MVGQITYYTQRWRTGRDINAEYFTVKIINNIECPKPDFVVQTVAHKVH